MLRDCRERIGRIEVDRLRVKPIVKITGEFWAQTTEGDGNFNMFTFLEGEGAHVLVDAIGCWIMYLMHQGKANARNRKDLDAPHRRPDWWDFKRLLQNEWKFRKKWLLLTLGERIWGRQYMRVLEGMGNVANPMPSQKELARLAHPFYHSLARGGEGHLEVGKNVYYTVHHLCHMVLALKPFGCMPSSQSDGVQSTVINRFPEMIFLPIETAGEGEINAHSRVQMALGEAKAKAKTEFDRCMESTGRRLEDIRDYVSEHPQLRSPLYMVPRRPDVAGVAANFVLHVSELMSREQAWLRRQRAKSGMNNNRSTYLAGLDIGSTTVKAVVVDVRQEQIVWRDYQRHETRQPEKLLEFLRRMESEVEITPDNCRMFITGSGGNSLAALIGAKFVQEVNAVSLAVEKLHPEVNSVVELGGQDAKIIIFKDAIGNGRKKKIPTMNDKCAGGTGAVIDKIVAKLKIPL